jgi:beta-mannosidase
MRNQSAEGALLVGAASGGVPLTSDWTLAPAAPNEIAEPGQLHAHKLSWIPARVPGTVAQALAAAKRWDFDDEDDFDASDWWYRTFFEGPRRDEQTRGAREPRTVLCFGGLATIAEVWLNGRAVLTASNMFESFEADVTDLLHDRNELVICFRSLNAALAKRRPRPRWKTRLVRQQQLRWMRTTLLGRIPGWSPPAAPVGPWRPITLETRSDGVVWDVLLRPSLDEKAGRIDFAARTALSAEGGVSAELTIGSATTAVNVERVDDEIRLHCHAKLPTVDSWWPHTHGTPVRYPCMLRVTVNRQAFDHDLGAVGFRSVDAPAADGHFGLRVNGEEIFCRGACWTPPDVVSVSSGATELRRALTLLRDAGANMVRVSGAMVYESDAFHELCDELGLLVWQDFMFANMDYPVDDAAFVESVRREALQQVRRFARHASMAVYCGNSEIEQQAAMLGVPRETWRSSLFDELLPAVCGEMHPGVPYVPSTPSGGVLPFHTASGLTHYYGVGAYMRPMTDVRRADVKFTPECLAFANVPEPDLIDEIMHGDPPATHDPRWKKRTPRDTGAGWDFEDVRDHYMRELFGVDPHRLRYADTLRYLELSRVATGEAMARVFAEWRRRESTCRGALVWFNRDLWPGAGWGIVDSRGVPKACYYYLRRAWQPLALLITDEGLNGVRLHIANERRTPWRGSLEIVLLRDESTIVAETVTACAVDAGDVAVFDAEQLLGGFFDTSYAYRFGAPAFDVLAAAVRNERNEVVSTALHAPNTLDARTLVANVTAAATPAGDDVWQVTVRSDRFLYGVRFDVAGFIPDDNYFHVLPARAHAVRLRRAAEAERPRGHVEALNLRAPVRIEVAG